MKITQAIIIQILFVAILTLHPIITYSQPDPPNGHGTNDDANPGGGAPIGGGTFILIALGTAYAGKKIYDISTENIEDND